MNTVIFTDSTCDLPLSYIQNNNIEFLGLTVLLQGKEMTDDLGQTLLYKDFYNILRNGEQASTSQINSYSFIEAFRQLIEKGKSIIYLGFSSALSGTYNSAFLAREELLQEYPEADITVIDTLAASCGQGLLIYYACEMLKSGKPKEEVVQWVKDNKLKVAHIFTVDDLEHLKRGGRISSTAAFVGSLLNIKPLLYVNDLGELKPYGKERGRKKAIRAMADELKKHIQSPEEQTIFISHGDCMEDAQKLADIIQESVSVKDIIISMVGTTIGSHSGPGTLALFFLSDTRTP